MSYLNIENLSASYDDFNLELSFSLEQNEFVSIIGPSGCGKSTTLSLISGLLPPKGGKITLDGKDISHLPPQERKIGMVFQDYALFPHLNVLKNIEYPLKLRKLSKKDIKSEAESALEFIHLKGYEKRKVSTLSGGEKQRVALARSLAAKPDLLLLDEPLSALDAALRRQLRSEIRMVQQATSTPFIYVTHDREEAFSLSDKIIVMNGGKVEMEGKPEEIYNHPNSLFTAFFTGDGTILESKKYLGVENEKNIFFRPESIKIYEDYLVLDSDDYIIIENATIMGYDYKGSEYLLMAEKDGDDFLIKTDKKPTSSHISLYLHKKNLLFL